MIYLSSSCAALRRGDVRFYFRRALLSIKREGERGLSIEEDATLATRNNWTTAAAVAGARRKATTAIQGRTDRFVSYTQDIRPGNP